MFVAALTRGSHEVGSVKGMSRARQPFIAQGTWQQNGLHVWGWNGHELASSAWIYGGFGRSRWSGADNSWHDSPISYGEMSRLEIRDLHGVSVRTPAVRLEPLGAAVWLSRTPTGDELSPSLAWFAQLTRLAVRCVSTDRISPVITTEGPFTRARWRPVLTVPSGDCALEELLSELETSAPQICRMGSTASATHILDTLVDGIARSQLHHIGWKAELGRQRTARVQALRGLANALSGPDPTLRNGTEDYHTALDALAVDLERHLQRCAGRPVMRPRVRLHVPADPTIDWSVGLEIVDESDPTRWCTAEDLWRRAPTALDLAGGAEHLGILEEVLESAVHTVVASLPGCGVLAEESHPARVDLDLEEAAAFLDRAPHELARAGVELLGPQHLVTAKVKVKGVARAAPADDRPGRFGKDALLEWSANVDGAELSETDLARITAAGATLMHTGNRWVRIEAEGLRRARTLLSAHAKDRSKVSALELMQLLGDDAVEIEAAETDPLTTEDADPDQVSALALLTGLPDEQLAEAHESEGFHGELRHYQRRGLGWLQFLSRLGLGGCLADDMGLGKTATTLAHLLEVPGPHLVICPLSVVHNWEAEAARFTPALTVRIHHGTDRELDDGLGDTDLVITTYGLLARDADLAEVDWSTVVLDEAQMIKNPGTRSARAARRLKARQKLALTGTPVENRLSELWSILDVVNPGLLGSQQRFRERYGLPIERHNDAEAAERLRRFTSPFVLRRTKADRRLVPDLPDKIEQAAYATLTREQTILYQQVVEQLLADAENLTGMQRRGRVLAALTRLKQICNHPAHALADGSPLAGRSGKLTRFDELIAELLDVEERALVFTQFREMGLLLQRHLREQLGLEVPFLHGGVSRGQRTQMVDQFQDLTGPPLLIISLKAGGTGLNLTAASQVIHYDRWWNPAVEDQATDRAWRIGQHNTVNVHKMICQGTVEERIGQVIDEKRALADAVIGSGEAWLSELSTAELRDLVVLEATSTTLSDRHTDPDNWRNL
jgi:hypothetical protein